MPLDSVGSSRTAVSPTGPIGAPAPAAKQESAPAVRAATDQLKISDRARKEMELGDGTVLPSMADEYEFYKKHMSARDVQRVIDFDEKKSDLQDRRAELLAGIPKDAKIPSDPAARDAFYRQYLSSSEMAELKRVDAESDALTNSRQDLVRQHISVNEESKSPQNKKLMDKFFIAMNIKAMERMADEMKANGQG